MGLREKESEKVANRRALFLISLIEIKIRKGCEKNGKLKIGVNWEWGRLGAGLSQNFILSVNLPDKGGVHPKRRP